MNNPTGEAHQNSKLKVQDAYEIIRAYRAKELNQPQLGRKYGVSTSAIWELVNGRTWSKELKKAYPGEF